MVKITAKLDCENKASKEVELKSCEMAYIVGIIRDGEEGYNAHNVLVGGKGLEAMQVIDILGESAVKLLVSVTNTEKNETPRYLLAYMKAFVEAIDRIAGEEVLNEVRTVLEE